MNIRASLDLFCFEKYLNYVRKWTPQFWKREEFHIWSTAGYLLEHCWNNGYSTFLENNSDVCNFAKLSIYISVNEWSLNSIRTCCYFGLHFSWWKVTNLSPGTFSFVSKIIEAKIMWSGVSNSHELISSTTKKAFTDSFFDYSTNLFHFFRPNYPPSFRPQPRLLKHEQRLFLIRTNPDRVCALDTRFRAYLRIKRLLRFIHASRGNPTKNWRVC